jgi:quercetin dioxygenase-like cupin family protein
LVSIAVGGSFAMHSGPEYSFCQIVEGQGKLGLPGGEAVDYRAPELFIFDPDTVHDWHDITAETLVAVCSVKA